MRPLAYLLAIGAFAALARPAVAEVSMLGDTGFVSRHQVEVPAPPDLAWQTMLQPGLWWSGGHTYSGDARNMSLAAEPGGCFCEAIPATADGGAAGAIEHMRVIYVAPRAALRMTGGLGPLQSEPVTGVLTMTIEPAGSGSKITWEYAVGGTIRPGMARMAPLVDGVMGEQLGLLAARLSVR